MEKNGLFSMSRKKIKISPIKELQFNGIIYVLMDHRTYSAVTEFAIALSDNQITVTIDRPTGGMPS